MASSRPYDFIRKRNLSKVRGKLLYECKTPYHKLKVVDKENLRYLVSGTGMAREQACIDLEDVHRHVFDYSLLAMNSLCFLENISSALVVGLGGGVIPRELHHHYPDVKIDVLEIDPEMVKVAKEYFFFPESENVRVILGDAFTTLRDSEESYDFVMLDAFLENYTPFHLMTTEFLALVKKVTSPEGIVTVNAGNSYLLFNRQLNTLIDTFGESIYEAPGPTNDAVSSICCPLDHRPPKDTTHFKKIEISEDVKNASIFTMESV